MASFAPGQFAVIKVREDREGDRFMFLYIDPEQAERLGYMWSDEGEMSEPEMRAYLAKRELSDSKTATLLCAAREQWDASQ